ncbi:metal-sensing transcriptional repressor [Gehongia tenuis]|uniref:Copper-sensing transcriptional repressor CsoR n=1 Tax=Gehongia tenuis TaxID=2763655 RepID=A0A926HQ61_9FIRM|nr:metal-sensing transcriptional repressor [Gehongia tenuis]MBC8531410.1 metal-sensing transcriptional repressor [Gehongia tenuis]
MKADKTAMVRLLKTARGQMDGILKMMEEDRYCVDISNQILATESILRKVNKEIIRAHMQSCVREGLKQGDEDKIEELLSLFEKMNKG